MLKAEAAHCVNETRKNSVRCQVDSQKDSDQRLADIKVVSVALQDELKFNIAQAHELLELKERLDHMLKSLERPLEIAQENLNTRETRQGAELVHDHVEDCLLRELESLQRCEEDLLDEMDKINAQLTKLRNVRLDLEADIRNKEQAANTDECVRLLNELSAEIGNIDIPPGLTTLGSPDSWMANTQSLIQRSQEERKSSQLLDTVVSRAMLSAADESFGAWYDTNAAFNERISKISHAKQRFERLLAKIKHYLDILKNHLDEVKGLLEKTGTLLQAAQKRLEKRKERPAIELCRDQAMMSLLREIHELKTLMDQMTTQSTQAELSFQRLLKDKVSLEHELKLKNLALFVDREKCLWRRQTFPMSTFKDSRYPNKAGPVGDVAPMLR